MTRGLGWEVTGEGGVSQWKGRQGLTHRVGLFLPSNSEQSLCRSRADDGHSPSWE